MHGVGGGEGGDAVGEAERRQGRRAVGLARDGREAAHRLGEGAEAGPGRVGAGLAEAGHAGDDEPRVGGVQGGRSEVPAFEGAGPEVLDEDVGVGREPQQERRLLRAAEVDGDGALVATQRLPPQADAVLGGAVAAGGSGRRGCSTLITSAPKSPRKRRGDRAGEEGGRSRGRAGLRAGRSCQVPGERKPTFADARGRARRAGASRLKAGLAAAAFDVPVGAFGTEVAAALEHHEPGAAVGSARSRSSSTRRVCAVGSRAARRRAAIRPRSGRRRPRPSGVRAGVGEVDAGDGRVGFGWCGEEPVLCGAGNPWPRGTRRYCASVTSWRRDGRARLALACSVRASCRRGGSGFHSST